VCCILYAENIKTMEPYTGLIIATVLLLIAMYSLLYQDATAQNMLMTFLLLCFIGYFTVYIIDIDSNSLSSDDY
jgi:hypothetical protein